MLFIDEIHRLARVVEEILYPAMEDFELNIVVASGLGARTMKLSVKPFTMIGATPRSGLLSSPLRDSFGQHYHLDFYARTDLTQIIQHSAHLLGVRIDDEGAGELAARSRGTPRITNRLLRRVRDFVQVNEASVVTREVALQPRLRLPLVRRSPGATAMNALYRVLTLKEAARYLHVRRRVLQRKLPPRYRSQISR